MLESNQSDRVTRDAPMRRQRLGLSALVFASGMACMALGGCATAPAPGTAGLSADFGQAVAHNREAQFVAPSAEQKENTYIRPNAARQRLALETYVAGEVELEETALSEVD
jgi:hypothetical protein